MAAKCGGASYPFFPFNLFPFRPMNMRLPYFSRAQQGVILLLGAALLLLWAWRANFFLPPSPPPATIQQLVFVEITGAAAKPGVYKFEHPPTLAEVWQKSGGAGTAPASPDKIASGSRVEIAPDGRYQIGSHGRGPTPDPGPGH